MSDIASELPIRSQLPGQVLPDDVIVKIGDGTNPTTQFLAVDSAGKIFSKLNDSAGNDITSQVSGAQRALDVGINVAGVQIDPRAIRALTSADVVSVVQSTSPWIVKDQSDGAVANGSAGSFSGLAGLIYLSAAPTLVSGNQNALLGDVNGNLLVNLKTALPAGANVIGAVTQSGGPWTSNVTQIGGSALALGQTTMSASIPVTFASNQSALPVTQSGTWTVGLSEDHNYGTVGATTLRVASQIGNATGAANFGNGATGAQTLRVAANLAIAGADVSGTNPVPVSITSALVGTSVNDYKAASAIAAGSSDNHDYTITTSKTFQGKLIWASASGLMKIEVQISPDGTTFTSKWVGFNSTATPNIYLQLDELVFLESGTGSKIRVICTNLDKKSQDLYSTISGTEV